MTVSRGEATQDTGTGGDLMTPAVQTRATLDDLMRVEGKAELIGGRIVRFMATGRKPSRSPLEIVRQPATITPRDRPGRGLRRQHGLRRARAPFGPRVVLSRRLLLRRPAARRTRMRFITGAADLRRRSPQRERLRPGRRARDGRQAGRLLRRGDRRRLGRRHRGRVIHVYRADTPEPPATYARGQVAEAEPAVPAGGPRSMHSSNNPGAVE